MAKSVSHVGVKDTSVIITVKWNVKRAMSMV